MDQINHGDVLRVPVRGHPIPVLHYGIAARDPWGRITVISNSKRRRHVVEETLEAFAEGQPVTIVDIPRGRTPHAAVAHARNRIGQTYDLVGDNCEHFVRTAVGAAVVSLQVLFWGAVAAGMMVTAGVGFYCLTRAPRHRRRRLARR